MESPPHCRSSAQRRLLHGAGRLNQRRLPLSDRAFVVDALDGRQVSRGDARRDLSVALFRQDEHLLGEQRYYNALCMLYGANSSKWEKLVTEGYLPKERAVRCPAEYQKAVDAWSVLLGPWRKN